MKLMRRAIALMLCLCMVLPYLDIPHAHAAGGSTNVALYVDQSTVSVDGTVTVVISNAETTASALGVYLSFDKDLLECTNITGVDDDEFLGLYYSGRKGAATWVDAQVGDTVVNTNSDGIFSFGYVTTKDTLIFEGKIATLTFTAKAPGTVTFTLNEDSAGTDKYYGVADTATLTIIGGSESSCEHNGEYRYEDNYDDSTHKVICDDCGEVVDPAEDHFDDDETGFCDGCGYEMVEECEHATTNPVSTGNDTHNIVCGDCGVVIDNEDCSGGTATCSKKAVCAICKAEYGDYDKDNHEGPEVSGGFFPNNDGTHYEVIACDACKNELRTVPGTCYGGTATCTQKPVCDDCGAEYGTVAEHEVDPSKGTTEEITKPATCTEEGTKVVTSFCSCGYEFTAEVPIPVDSDNHDWDITYTWDGASCTATRSCSREGCKVPEETAEGKVTGEITTPATCTDAGWTTYTVTFDEEWAAEFNGETYTIQNVPATDHKFEISGYTDDGATHTVHYECVNDNCEETKSEIGKPHDFNNADHKCACKQVEKFTVTWTVDGEEYTTTDVKFGAAIAAPAENPTKTGHTFSGWKDVPETMPDDENLTIEAEFTVNNYQVRWDANGGAFKLGGIEQSYVGSDVPYGSVITFSGFNLPVREGYSFDGWADASGNPLTDETVMNTTDNLTVYYAQWKANSYTLYVYDWMSEATMLDEIQVPYGEKLLDYLKAEKCVDIEVTDGVYTFADFWYLKDGEGYAVEVDAEDVMPADDYTVYAAYVYTGWAFDSFGTRYYVKDELQTGWFEVDGAWYYLDPNNNDYRVEDVARVPYPTEAINGITYGPDAEDLAYWEAHKDTSRYSDATTAMFVFGEDGKFQHDLTGMVFARCYAVNGMIPWHYGLAEVNGEYYYFIGDTSDGSFGNSVAMGDVTVSRLNGINGVLDEGATYNFAGGKLSGVDGISNGKYYEDSKLMKGNGLTKYGDEYIYVRSTGEIVVNADYYVPANDLGIVSGMYKFNENGFMVEPKTTDKNGIVDGIYYRDGKPYYAGLIEIDGSMYYINSSYKVVTGTYYVTKTNEEVTGIAKGTKLVFGEDGKLIPPKNGIYEESGKLYYYENDRIMKGAGVVKLTDEEGETFYIYVRSNGQLATGIYWPTTSNDLLARGPYNWGADGKYYPNKA